MRTIQRDIVSALIFSSDNKLFMGRKDPKEGGVYTDCWHIPGGGIEKDETKIEALIREIREETGISITEKQIELVSDDGTGTAEKTLRETGERVVVEMKFFVYKVSLKEDAAEIEVSLTDDLAKYQWFQKDELSTIKLTPPSVKLFKKLKIIG